MQSFLLFQMLRQQKDACKAIVLDKNKLIKDFQEVEITLSYDSGFFFQLFIMTPWDWILKVKVSFRGAKLLKYLYHFIAFNM